MHTVLAHRGHRTHRLQTEDTNMARTTRTTIVAQFAVLFLGIGAAAPAHLSAQSTVKGFSVGAHGAMTAIADDESPTGHGVSVMVGYGVNERLSFHAATSGARIGAKDTRDGFFQSFIDLESRVTLGAKSGRWRPQLALGVSARNDHEDQPEQDDPKVRTTIGATAGAGLSYFLTSAVSLDGAVRYTIGDANRTRLLVGVTWFPWSR